MANYNCDACNELRENAPNLVVNGFNEDNCTSLKNDTGLVASVGNDDFTDLNLLNDCLIHNMVDEVDAYDTCSWRDYMRKFANNLWTTLKAIICSLGGYGNISTTCGVA